MKVYTIYLDGDRGWTADKIDGFYNEVENAKELVMKEVSVPTEEDFNNQLLKLNTGDSYTLYIGESPTTIMIKCEDMPEEEFNSLDEFSGW